MEQGASCSILLALKRLRQNKRHLTYKEIDEEQLCPYLNTLSNDKAEKK